MSQDKELYDRVSCLQENPLVDDWDKERLHKLVGDHLETRKQELFARQTLYEAVCLEECRVEGQITSTGNSGASDDGFSCQPTGGTE